MNEIENCICKNIIDKQGNPAGGYVSGVGLRIDWQNGPLGQGDNRQKPNGAFVETVIAASIERLKFYQESEFKGEENARAIQFLDQALDVLNERTKSREKRGVEGTHQT